MHFQSMILMTKISGNSKTNGEKAKHDRKQGKWACKE
jgi:hypothetical protein